MTSQARIDANRRNAKHSTGPRTALGKARVRKNALRHGLASTVLRDPAISAEIARFASSMEKVGLDALTEDQARDVAEALVIEQRVRDRRRQIIEKMSACDPNDDPKDHLKAQDARRIHRQRSPLDELLGLERYERRAVTRKNKTALAIAASGGTVTLIER